MIRSDTPSKPHVENVSVTYDNFNYVHTIVFVARS